MSVNDLQFLGFVLLSVLLYYLRPGKYRWIVLLTASGIFYLSNGVTAALYMGATVVLTYTAGRILDKIVNIKPAGDTPEEKKRQLFLDQKKTLDMFLEKGAITQAQYNKSLGDLREKMGIRE